MYLGVTDYIVQLYLLGFILFKKAFERFLKQVSCFIY